jgi:mRNA interferase RelE/StbE
LKIYSIEFKASAKKDLERLPRIIQVRILDAMRMVAMDPFSPLLPIRKMEGRSTDTRFRLRVAKYRVVYEVQKEKVIIFVIRVGHRKDVYR